MAQKSRGNSKYVLVLHDIRSVFNMGALFRTADAVGITRIIISGFSPTPIDRFGRHRLDFAKSALGAEKTISWEYLENVIMGIQKLKSEGFQVIGIEQNNKSTDYKKVLKQDKMVFIIGTETTGVSEDLIKQCDVITEIPMNGLKESLNVSVAAGIVLYRILDK